jgi:hypothetical protein
MNKRSQEQQKNKIQGGSIMLRHQGRRLTAAVVTAALLAGFGAVGMAAAAEVQPEEQEDPPTAVVEKNVHGFTVDGSFRYLYGQGHFEGESLARTAGGKYAMTPFKEMMIMQTLRTRLYANYHFDKNWKFITGVEDNRVFKRPVLDGYGAYFPVLCRRHVSPCQIPGGALWLQGGRR